MHSPVVKPKVWPQINFHLDKKSDRKKYKCKYLLNEKALGDGSFSRVYEGKNLGTNKYFAVKCMQKSYYSTISRSRCIQSEFAILSKIARYHVEHPNDVSKRLLKLYDYFETENHFYFVTDLAISGDLFDMIINRGAITSEADGISLVNKVTSALCFLKEKINVVHCDIKAENIFFKYFNSFDDFDIIIGDFGLSRFHRTLNEYYQEGSDSLIGTLSYMAPEILNNSITKTFDYQIDIWALGVVIYFIYCGYMPFDCETDDQTKEAIKTADFSFEPENYWGHVSNDIKQGIISRCFVVDPEKRITIEDLYYSPLLKPKKGNFNSQKLFIKIPEVSPISEKFEGSTNKKKNKFELFGSDEEDDMDIEENLPMNKTTESDTLSSNGRTQNLHKNLLTHDLQSENKEREKALLDLKHTLLGSLFGGKEGKGLSKEFDRLNQKSVSYTSLNDCNLFNKANSSTKLQCLLVSDTKNCWMKGQFSEKPEMTGKFPTVLNVKYSKSKFTSNFNSINPSRIASKDIVAKRRKSFG